MLFNSVEFLLIFLPIVLAGFYLTIRYHGRYAQWVLILASLVFYSYWDIRYLPLLVGSIFANYLIGNQLIRRTSRVWLATGVGFNLSLLGIFKYTDFFIETVNKVADQQFDLLHIALPLAISFFTFQQIAYLVDCYQQKIKQNYGFSHYALFVSYFPQLIAGPIVHHKSLVPQFTQFGPQYQVDAETISKGLVLLLVGLFKKVVIADTLALYVNPAFANIANLSFYDAWTAMLGFTLELYFDFSAYCEIAMGLGLLFGIRLPINFLSPYKANTIQDFWRRWHITLGAFLKNYLYIPLGGNRSGTIQTIAALTATMLLGGLWHGADWHYVVWGGMHGVMLAIYFLWQQTSIKLPTVLARTLTFCGVMLAWIMFRADTYQAAMSYYSTLFGFNGISLPPSYVFIHEFFTADYINITSSLFYNGIEFWLLLVLVAFTHRSKNVHEFLEDLKPHWKPALAITASAGFIAFNLGSKSTFLYFQF